MNNNNDKILKALERIEKTQQEQGKRLDNTASKQDIAQVYTIVEAVKAGQDDIREGNNRIEQKLDNLAKDVRNQKKRIENLEEHTGAENPLKH